MLALRLDPRSRPCREVPIKIPADPPVLSIFHFHFSIFQFSLSYLESTLMKSPVSVASKELTGSLSLLDATLMKKQGGGGGVMVNQLPWKLRRSAKMELYQGGDTVSTEAVAARRHAGSHLPVTWWKTRNANNNLALAA